MMRFILIVIALICVSPFTYGQQNELKTVFDNKVITINSASNARLLGGKTRQVVEFEVPKNAKNWYWKIIVLKKDSPLSHLRKPLVNVLVNNFIPGYGIIASKAANSFIDGIVGTFENCDIYILPTREDALKFLELGNWDFNYTKKWINEGEFGTYLSDVKGKIFMGFINTNVSIGLDVHLDVVIEFPETNKSPKLSTSNKNYSIGPFVDNNLAYTWFIDGDGSSVYGYVNRNLEVEIPFQFEQAFPFYNGKALVKKNGVKYYIDIYGKKVKDYVEE